MAVVKVLGDGVKGVFVQMQSGAIGTTQPVPRQNLACTPFSLVKNADGTVGASVTGTAKFITSNTGQDYRNANHPDMYVINGGANALVTFNYRPQGTNDTNRYAIVVDSRATWSPCRTSTGQVRSKSSS